MATVNQGSENRRPRWAKSLNAGRLRNYAVPIFVVVLFVGLSLSSSVFFSSRNLLNLLEQSVAVGIIAAGSTMVMVSGCFDLSVGGLYAMCGVIAAKLALVTSPALALVVGVVAGLAIGVVNGVIVTVGRVNAFIATLATSFILLGLATIVTRGRLITVSDPAFTVLGRGEFLGLKWMILALILFCLAAGIALAMTTYGRHVYAAGGNQEAARLSGVGVRLVRIVAYAVSGLGAGLAGVIIASRVGAGQANASVGIELTVIAAMVVGGTSIMGGEGSVARSFLGVLLLALILNGFNLLGVPSEYHRVFQGMILLIAVGADVWSRRSR